MKINILQRVSQVKKCFIFLTLLKFREDLSVTEKNVSDWKEKTENKNDRTEMTGVHFGGRSPENVQS